MHPNFAAKVEAEVDKFGKGRFHKGCAVSHLDCERVPIKNKKGQIWAYIDFKDLKEACPKDDFSIPHMGHLIEAKPAIDPVLHGWILWVQSNKNAPRGWMGNHFAQQKELFYYQLMFFGLKNTGATYQRAMTIIFNEILGDMLEHYIVDLVVKPRQRRNHFETSWGCFQPCHQVKMNPSKYAFKVTLGKLVGFIVRHRKIEVPK